MLSVQILVPLVIIILSLTFFRFKMWSMGSVPLQLALNTYGQTIVPFFVSQNFKLDPQLLDHFPNMLVAQGQIPLEVPGNRAQGNGAQRRAVALCRRTMFQGHVMLSESH